MRALTTEQLIEVCAASADQVDNAAQLLGRTFDCDASMLQAGIKAGWYQAHTVKVDGQARFLLVWHKTDQGACFINAAAQLTPEPNGFPALVSGMISLAKAHACNAVEGITIRAGVLKQLFAAGFKPIGVSVHYAV